MAKNAIINKQDSRQLFMRKLEGLQHESTAIESLTQAIADTLAPTFFTADNKVANITELGDVGGEAEEVDTTAFDSDGKEAQPGSIDNGTFDLSLQITDAKVARVLNAWQANSDMIVFDQVLYMKSGKPAFSQMGIGYIQAFHVTGALNEIVTAQATIRVSGALYDVTHKTPDKAVVGATHDIPQDLKDSTSVFQAGA